MAFDAVGGGTLAGSATLNGRGDTQLYATNLDITHSDGGNVTQISFNQSHDRNPTVRQNGDIMFSRWDHVGGRNHFKIFRAKPDGTDLFVLYGAHSSGNSFLHPRDMDPKGKYKGFVASDLMPLSGTHEGGGHSEADEEPGHAEAVAPRRAAAAPRVGVPARVPRGAR